MAIWMVKGYRGLDFKALGCSPTHTDLICLISRYDDVKEDHVKSEMARAIKFYADLNVSNPDGKKGFAFHPIYLDTVKAPDHGNAWWTNRDKFRPERWKGLVHWMQIAQGGGGQADELGDGGGCGQNALWAVFVHEFGHQMGLNHEGFWKASLCPIYPSLMNYAYSYSLNDSRDQIRYSDGTFKDLILNENDLDENLPWPYEKVKFLEKGPYRFRLKPNGNTTLIDWNWNGVFGEKHVRADINYSYSTNAGVRDDVGHTQTAPYVFVHEGKAYVLFGLHDKPADVKTDPTVGPDKPGRVLLRRLIKPTKWEEVVTVESGGLIGDPVAASFAGRIWVAYQTTQGVMMRSVRSDYSMTAPQLVDSDKTCVPTIGVHDGQLVVFLTNPTSGVVRYRTMDRKAVLREVQTFDTTATSPVGICSDTHNGDAIVGLCQDIDKTKTKRWQVRRYRLEDGKFRFLSKDWIADAAGVGRVTVLFDGTSNAGPTGRIYFYCLGTTSTATPWQCVYMAHQIADKTVHGGWLVKRFYDEWTQTRSAPAAAWFAGDILYAYRWVDGGQGASDNVLHVGYRGLGIDSEPMSDFDDIGFLHDFGIRNSLIYLSRSR